ncbi:putative cardiolipin synthase YwiE [mine drainage metagenome]|uniref:Putative cardiolipin synthase YwiE n=1 Tax=mine drainage metagenome TaxID=410659 RepID=A0A1J5QGQ3_9ZZZZ
MGRPGGGFMPGAPPAFQIVESVPEATAYGQPDVPRTQQVWLDLISNAQKRIDLAAFYISNQPGEALQPVLDALIARARAGIAVRILLDANFMKQSQAAYDLLRGQPGIEVKYSALPEAPQGFIPYARVEHCKYAVADGRRSYIGTGNWSWSYFETTVDASLFIAGAAPARTLEAIFERDWMGRYVHTIEPGNLYKAPDLQPKTHSE